jgi:hypothetical protein
MMTDNLPAIPETGVFESAIAFEYEGESYNIWRNRLYNSNGQVAVVYSPGYGGGWTTWNRSIDPADARVAVLTLTGMSITLTFETEYSDEKEIRFADSKFYQFQGSDMNDDLAIEWLDTGTLYRITEYDGFESIETQNDTTWRQA